MSVDINTLAPLTVHDILLLNEPSSKTVVRTKEEFSFQVKIGQIVIWKFSTEDFDIGFSVLINGESKIAFTRYKSHEKPAMGSLGVYLSIYLTN